jgi:hypothetical protein
MSVPRKRRPPAWHLLTDEGGSMNSRFLSALFPSAAQAHAAAEVLERRGAVLFGDGDDASLRVRRNAGAWDGPGVEHHFRQRPQNCTGARRREHRRLDQVMRKLPVYSIPRYPVLLVKRLFSGGTPPRELTLVGTKAASSGVVISTYRPSGPLRTASFDDGRRKPTS